MRLKSLATTLLLLLALALPASSAHAGGVVTVCDEAHLRAALAGPQAGGTVTFACSGTIVLASEITIETDTTIDGSGQVTTISGNHRLRPFRVVVGATLNLNMLTVAHGWASAGAGIYNFGTLNLTNSTLSDNASLGGGIVNYGIATVINSHLWGNTVHGYSPGDFPYGGGIYNDGALTVIDSTFSSNHADWAGGGIYNLGTLTVIHSTFAGNNTGRGGGIFSDHGTFAVTNSTFVGNSASGTGGGIDNHGSSTLTVTNSTFVGNSAAGGGGIANRGSSTLTVANSTFVGNHTTGEGGGVYNLGTLTVTNSTLAGNDARSGGGINNPGGMAILSNTILANNPAGRNCAGIITDGGGNLSYPDTTCPGINGDPMLGRLQDNGGPTETMALDPGSAAIDAGLDEVCAAAPVNNFDQRGVLRPYGAHCDIGAYEAGAEPLPIRGYFPYIR